MPVIVNGNSLRPSPQVSLSKEVQNLADGRRVGSVLRITLNGTLVPEKINGIYNPVDVTARLSTIITQQKNLRDIFAKDGINFEIQGWDGASSTRCVANVKSIEFAEGVWTDKCDYTVVLESTNFSDEVASENVETASENWQFEDGDTPKTTKITHSVSAKGKTVYNASGQLEKKAWEVARDFVKAKLGLGYKTKTDVDWSPKSGEDLAGESEVHPLSTNEWNHIVSESIDEIEGSYQATETWILSQYNWTEDYSISVERVVDQPKMSMRAVITGTVRGLYKDQNDFDARYENALTRWTTVKTLIKGRADTAAGIVLEVKPVAASVDHRKTEGTIQYTYEYNDRKLDNDTYETYNVSTSTSYEDYKSVVRIEGSIVGVMYADESDNAIKLVRATSRWGTVKSTLLSRAIAESGITSLSPFPTSAQFTSNGENGSVSYSYEFDTRVPSNVKDDFSVSQKYDRESGITTITIEGHVVGLRSGSDPFGGSQSEMYENAKSYFSARQAGMFGIAGSYFDTDKIYKQPTSISISHIPNQATINYSYEYSTVKGPCTPGALSESVTISDQKAVPIVASINVIGRKKGPIFQDMSTQTASSRTVTMEVVMSVDDPCVLGDVTSVDVEKYAPKSQEVVVQEDSREWNPRTGRLTRRVNWLYNE